MAHYQGIREFITVVERGSFSKAAEQLNLSGAQVSRLVKQLEKNLGVSLLYRNTRNISLTDEGNIYYKKCKKSYAILENAEQEIGKGDTAPSGILKINLSGWFQEQFLVPMLVDFGRQYPKLNIDVTFTDNHVDMVTKGFDLSICAGKLSDSSLVAKKIGSSRFCICASPDYLKKRGTPKKLSDLNQHNCLNGSTPHWPLSQENKNFNLPVNGNWKSDNAHAILAATVQHAGLSHLPVSGVDSLLRTGTLVEVLPEHTRKGILIWALYPTRSHISSKVRLFVDFSVEQIPTDNINAKDKQYYFGSE